jgi:thioredoxin-dependent peroxiredoxin
VLGISPQDLDSHERWAEKRELPFVLLADVDKRVISLYGVKGPGLIPVRRSVFVIDPEGVVRFANRKLIGATFVPADTLVPVLETL